MPIIKSAIKKMRVDVKRRQRNLDQVSSMRTALKKANSTKKFEAVSEAYSALDRAVKAGLVHRNYAAHQKANLSKLAKPTKLVEAKTTKKVSTKTKKAAPKKTAKTPVKKTSKK